MVIDPFDISRRHLFVRVARHWTVKVLKVASDQPVCENSGNHIHCCSDF